MALLLAGGCSKSGGDSAPQEVRIGYFPNVTHAQAVLGASSGEFAQALAPAKLSAKTFNAGPSLIEALFSKEVDIGYVGPSPALNGFARSNGEGLRIVAGAAANGVVIVARKGSGIKSLTDLKGHKLATPQIANTQDVSAKHYLTSVLGQADTTNVLPIANAEQAGMMRRGDIDAAWTPEPWGARLVAEADAEIIGEEKDLWPDKQFTLTVIVTTPEYLARHPEVIEKVLRVHRQWTARLQQDSAKYEKQLGDALFAINHTRLPEGVLPAALGRVQFTDEPLEQTLKTYAQWAYELKMTRDRPALDGLVDAGILRKLQAEKTSAAPGGKQ
ncbi:MAG TPA: ABC transporter substrate-binding protein [Tepidisphaeraceae bacterium]